MVSILTLCFISLAWGIFTGLTAHKKNRNFVAWFAAGCFMWFLPFIALILLKRKRLPEMTDTEFRMADVPTTIFPDTRAPQVAPAKKFS
jgi:hypothetical protein